MVAYLLAPRVNWVPLQHPGYAAYSQPYTQLSVIPPAGYLNVLPGAVEDLVLAPACRPARAQTVVGPQVPDEGSAARTG